MRDPSPPSPHPQGAILGGIGPRARRTTRAKHRLGNKLIGALSEDGYPPGRVHREDARKRASEPTAANAPHAPKEAAPAAD